MSTLFASPAGSRYRRSITPSNKGIGTDGRSPFKVVMDSMVRLLADRVRLSSPPTINALSGLIARGERTVNTVDLESALIAVWKALLVIMETPAHNQSVAYWGILKDCL